MLNIRSIGRSCIFIFILVLGRITQAQLNQQIKPITQVSHVSNIIDVAFDEKNNILATLSDTKEIVIWDTNTRLKVKSINNTI